MGGLNNRRMARVDRFLVPDDWDIHLRGPVQSLLPKPTSNHFPVLLEGGGAVVRGSMPFKLKNMWLKENDFMGLVRNWWQSFEVEGSSRFVLMEKLKALKCNLKSWNKEVFRRVEERKKAALKALAHWDNVEAQRPFSVGEKKVKVKASDEFKGWGLLWKKCLGDRNLGRFG